MYFVFIFFFYLIYRWCDKLNLFLKLDTKWHSNSNPRILNQLGYLDFQLIGTHELLLYKCGVYDICYFFNNIFLFKNTLK